MDRRKFFSTMGRASLAVTVRELLTKQYGGQVLGRVTDTPALQLEAVQFSHGGDGSSPSIRQNETQTITNVEWQRDANGQHLTAPAAYIRFRTGFVMVTLLLNDPSDQRQFKVRAIYQDDPSKVALLSDSARDFDATKAGNPFRLHWESGPGQTSGVGVYDVSLRWQYLLRGLDENNNDLWMDFAATDHRIYTLLDRPNSPWSNESGDVNVPWVEVLDLSCRWAQGATTVEEAAARITEQLYNLGREIHPRRPGEKILAYGKPGGYTETLRYNPSTNMVTPPRFYLTAFLKYLKDGTGTGGGGSCVDFAAMVVTFSNILGCLLQQRKFVATDNEGFTLNSCLLIGSEPDDWRNRTTANDKLSEFDNHVIATHHPDGRTDLVYDACLAVDGDGDPTPPHTARVPTNMRFGPQTDRDSYLHNLVDEQDRRSKQFFIFNTNDYPAFMPIIAPTVGGSVDRRRISAFQRSLTRFSYRSWRGTNTLGRNLFIWQYKLANNVLPSWRLEHLEQSMEREWARVNESLWVPANGVSSRMRMHFTVFECNSRNDAQSVLLQMLHELDTSDVQRHLENPVGDISFGDVKGSFILFARANLIARLRNVGAQHVSVRESALAFDAGLIQQPEVPVDTAASPTNISSLTERFQRFGFILPIEGAGSDSGRAAGGGPVWHKFFSRGGEIQARDGRLVFIPASSRRPQQVDIYTIKNDGTVTRRNVVTPAVQPLRRKRKHRL